MNKLQSSHDIAEVFSSISNAQVQDNAIINIEQDYALYKAGIRFYKKIHPSSFYKPYGINGLFTGFEKHDYEKQLEVFRDILDCFYMSERFFNRLIQDYPTSIWKEDAIEKINYMEKLKARYYKMDFNND